MIRALLQDLKERGHSISAYVAAAKGATLLNTLGVGHEIIDAVADRSPHKQGHYMPGVRIPIASPEQVFEGSPDYVLLLAWNYADEVLKQQDAYRQEVVSSSPSPNPRWFDGDHSLLDIAEKSPLISEARRSARNNRY